MFYMWIHRTTGVIKLNTVHDGIRQRSFTRCIERQCRGKKAKVRALKFGEWYMSIVIFYSDNNFGSSTCSAAVTTV